MDTKYTVQFYSPMFHEWITHENGITTLAAAKALVTKYKRGDIAHCFKPMRYRILRTTTKVVK